MPNQITHLAYLGDWNSLLSALAANPQHVNAFKEPKRYTPLHQAAWHGAPPEVIGALLLLGADPSLLTGSKRQSAFDIAVEKHPKRQDLRYLLTPRRLTIAQLLRKAISSTPNLFEDYDGNQLLSDRIVSFFDGPLDHDDALSLEARIGLAFKSATGVDINSTERFRFDMGASFGFEVDPTFWSRRLLPLILECAKLGEYAPLEREWSVVSDLFDPVPESWGLRGDLFLWQELRSSLARVALPEGPSHLEAMLRAAYRAHVGHDLSRADVYVPRLARGGMSSGMVNGQCWEETLLPLLVLRFRWLQASWPAVKPAS